MFAYPRIDLIGPRHFIILAKFALKPNHAFSRLKKKMERLLVFKKMHHGLDHFMKISLDQANKSIFFYRKVLKTDE